MAVWDISLHLRMIGLFLLVNIGFILTASAFNATLVQFRPCKVTVSCVGKLGNQLIALIYGIHAASVSQTKLELSEFHCYPDLITPKHKTLVLDFNSSVGGQTSSSQSQALQPLHQQQCYGEEEHHAFLRHPVVPPTIHQALQAAKSLQAIMSLDGGETLQMLVRSPDTMTIYLRGGDIFTTNIHPSYIQAPCVFFDKVIDDLQPSRLVVIAADVGSKASNPCLQTILTKHRDLSPIVFTATVKDSFSALAHAHTLVLSGVTSFGLTSALVNHNLARLVLPMYYYKHKDNSRALPYIKSDLRWHLPRRIGKAKVLRYAIKGYPTTAKWSHAAIRLMQRTYPVTAMDRWPVEYKHPWSSQTSLMCLLSSPKGLRTELKAFVDHIAFMVVKRYPSASLLPGPMVIVTCDSVANAQNTAEKYDLPLYLLSFLSLEHHSVCNRTMPHVEDDLLSQARRFLRHEDPDDCMHLEHEIVSYLQATNPFQTTHLTWYKKSLLKMTGKQVIETANRILYTPMHPQHNTSKLFGNDKYHIYQLELPRQ